MRRGRVGRARSAATRPGGRRPGRDARPRSRTWPRWLWHDARPDAFVAGGVRYPGYDDEPVDRRGLEHPGLLAVQHPAVPGWRGRGGDLAGVVGVAFEHRERSSRAFGGDRFEQADLLVGVAGFDDGGNKL